MSHATLHITAEGRMVAALALLCLGAGAHRASMALFAIGCLGLALLLVAAWSTWRNLRGVSVVRRPPAEFFAGRRAFGSWTIRRQSPRAAAAQEIFVADDHSSPVCGMRVDFGTDCEVMATWMLPARGPQELGSVVIWSRWPWGFWQATRRQERDLEVMVFPEPVPADVEVSPGMMGGMGGDGPRAGNDGDVRGLRPYGHRDRLGAIHWRSSARVGSLLVADRSDASGFIVIVPMPGASDGAQFEYKLGEACHAVLEAFRRGYCVGLQEGTEVTPARSGARWRRHLLGRLGAASSESCG